MKKANFVNEPINDPSKLSERQILYLKLSYKVYINIIEIYRYI